MDLRLYYQNIRKIEAEIGQPGVVVVGLATPDGGRRGLKTEVARAVAARMIAEDKARLATAEESAQFRTELEAKRRGSLGQNSGFSPALASPARTAKKA